MSKRWRIFLGAWCAIGIPANVWIIATTDKPRIAALHGAAFVFNVWGVLTNLERTGADHYRKMWESACARADSWRERSDRWHDIADDWMKLALGVAGKRRPTEDPRINVSDRGQA